MIFSTSSSVVSEILSSNCSTPEPKNDHRRSNGRYKVISHTSKGKVIVRGKNEVRDTSAIFTGLGTLGADPISREVDGFNVLVDRW